MILKGKNIDFPAVCKISFYSILDELEKQVNDSDASVAARAKDLLEEASKYPLLREGFSDVNLIPEYQPIIDKLCRTVFPDALLSNEIKAATPPFYFDPLYKSKRFKNIFKDTGSDVFYLLKDIDEDTYFMYCCYSILGGYYGYPVKGGGPMQIQLTDPETNLTKYYRMAFNGDMIEFLPTDDAIEITDEIYNELLDNFENIGLWKKYFPNDSWIMRGVGIINLMDVTIDQSLADISSNLLIKTDESFSNIRKGVKNLFGSSSVNVGIVTFDEIDQAIINIEDAHVTSILVSDNFKISCSDDMCEYTYQQLVKERKPLIIPDVEKYHESSPSSISYRLLDLGIRSYVITPLIFEDELLGFLELASTIRHELNTISISRIDKVLPVISMAGKKFKTDSLNQIEAIIQQECTTIHESVKWRFVSEAQNFLMDKKGDEQANFKDIVFKEVYPLYGQVDIRNSSLKRNEAVKLDLLDQIHRVRNIIESALEIDPLAAFEELIFRIDHYEKDIKRGLSAGSEHRILEFLRSDIYPVFKHIRSNYSKLSTSIDLYEKALNPEIGAIYNERKKYDTSVNLLNHRLAAFIDRKQVEAQKVFPHYFERYKTDGIEYNMYIGESIANNRSFDPIYLQNLRLWQLIVMCELEFEFKAMSEELESPIEVASLILAYSTPLAIHFRMDEKRFDVEGAYNARYEIIKKRVDKANIKGKKERITQPGHLVVIYSQDKDIGDYRKYFEFLSSKDYLYPEYEIHELEDLQGITGLKALRAKINYGSVENKKEGFTVDELMETLKK